MARACTVLGASALAACAPSAPLSAILDMGKVSSVVIGRSSRTDVFAVLGRPARTEQSLLGESWIYEAGSGDAGGQRAMSGASAAAGVAGAFVPYLGLVGSGLGLANATSGSGRRDADTVSLTVGFGATGLVRDCVYSSTAVPAGMPGAAGGPMGAAGCRRLAEVTVPAP